MIYETQSLCTIFISLESLAMEFTQKITLADFDANET